MKLQELTWHEMTDFLLMPACIMLAALAAGIFLNKLIDRQIRERITVGEDTAWSIFIHALRGVPVSWCLGVGVYWSIKTIDVFPTIAQFLSYVLFGIIVFTLTRVASRTITGFIEMKTRTSGAALPKTTLLSSILSGVIYAMGVLVVLQYAGISVAPILTAMGVGGAALALGMQETLSNIFSGLQLILSRQIRIGDYVRISAGEEGKVADINFRFTTVQTLGGNTIIVPNQKLASSVLTNYNMPAQEISVSIPVGVSYASDLDEVERVTLEVADEVMEAFDHGVESDPVVRFHTFGDSAIEFDVVLRTSSFVNQFLLKHEFIKALTRRYREEGIDIPFPMRTIVQAKE